MTRGIGIFALAALPLGALAQQPASNFDYTYVDVGYVDGEANAGPFEVDGDGLALRGSLALGSKLHVFGEYSTLDLDGGVDTTALTVGVGLHHALQSNLHFVGELGYVNAEVATPFGDADDDGLGLSAGLRYRANQDIELEGTIHYVDLDDSNTSLALRARYFFTPSFALTGGLLLDDGDTGWTIGIRAGF